MFAKQQRTMIFIYIFCVRLPYIERCANLDFWFRFLVLIRIESTFNNVVDARPIFDVQR